MNLVADTLIVRLADRYNNVNSATAHCAFFLFFRHFFIGDVFSSTKVPPSIRTYQAAG